jgi:hypothetical protein
MNAKSTAKLAETKLALARKYHHLAMLTSSTPRRANWLNKAEYYRRQAERLSSE